MAVIHILKDGTQVESIDGRVVRLEDAEPVYHLMDNINKRLAREKQFIHRKEENHE